MPLHPPHSLLKGQTLPFLPFLPFAASTLLGVMLSTAHGLETAREWEGGNPDLPQWDRANLALPEDCFSFARVEFNGGKWLSDYANADLNVSFRLQQLTSLEVNPDPPRVRFTDPELFDFPFLFMINPNHRGYQGSGPFYLGQDEGENLRNYLLNGGFLWVDDFWGRGMWENFTDEISQKVFPDREPVELAFDHPIFHNIFELDKLPQVPSHDAWDGTQWEGTGEKTFEPVDSDWDYLAVPRFMAWFDDDGRICMLVNLNNDISDGWEEEGFAPWFFNAFSERYCFPMAINVLFYAMTH